MKLKFIISLVLAFSVPNLSFGQSKTQDTLSQNFYKYFVGTIAGQPVHAEIWSIGGSLEGRYSYDKYKQNIALNFIAKQSTKKHWVFGEDVNISTPDDSYPIWKCNYQNGIITGTWYSKDRTKKYPIHLKSYQPKGTQLFTYKQVVHDIPYDTLDSKTPSMGVSYTFPVALGNSQKVHWLNQQIKQELGIDDTLSIKEGLQKSFQKGAKEYRHYLSKMDTSFIHSFQGIWGRHIEIHILYNKNGYVQLSDFYNGYSGGAHPNHAMSNSIYDVKNEIKLSWQDITSIDSLSLQKLIEAQVRKIYGLGSTDSLNKVLLQNYVPPTENFYFDAKGLTFIYNPYQVSSYADGIVQVFIAYEKLKGTLNPAFVKRMHLQIN